MKIIAPLLAFVLGVNCAIHALILPDISVGPALVQYDKLKGDIRSNGINEILFDFLQNVGISLKLGIADVSWNKTYGRYHTRNELSEVTGVKVKFSDCIAGRGTRNIITDGAINFIKTIFFGGHSEIKITSASGDILRDFEEFRSGGVIPNPNKFFIGSGFAEGKHGGSGIGVGSGTVVTDADVTVTGMGVGFALGSAAGNGAGPVVHELAEFLKSVVSASV